MRFMQEFSFRPLSILYPNGCQRVEMTAVTGRTAHYMLTVTGGETVIQQEVAMSGGRYTAVLALPAPKQDFNADIRVTTLDGEELVHISQIWNKPREWTFYVMVSSHTDIGLHNSQYIQRYNSERFLDLAMKLCDDTADRASENQFRYVMEGTWFWSNYPADRGKTAAERVVNEYIKKGRIGVCAGVAGNHTQTFGMEETCRCTYNRKWLKENFDLDIHTMTMIDNNGMNWGMVQPFADAGYENIIFAPNQWNPLFSTIFHRDTTFDGPTHNPDAHGGGSRVDVSYDSSLPMLFWWQDPRGKKMLVWSSTQYDRGGARLGLFSNGLSPVEVEDRMAKGLPVLEDKVPYDVWLLENYYDDQEPSIRFTDSITAWNKTHTSPKIRLLGNPDEPFNIVKERFGDKIPTLYGDMTGGWYQHPVAAPDFLADKFAADRRLADAEKISSIASVLTDELYSAEPFARAWAALLMNDEHSYGTSGYKGRRVFETWMQHRDWIDKATKTADTAIQTAISALTKNIAGKGERAVLFNLTALQRHETVKAYGGEAVCDIVPFGWVTVPETAFVKSEKNVQTYDCPPVVENEYYRLTFAENGSVAEIFDKQLNLVITSSNCNEFIYTEDNHATFHTPNQATFTVIRGLHDMTVIAETAEDSSGAALCLSVTLPDGEKRIDFDNRLSHVRGLYNTNRYYRYAYFGFPIAVENCRRICELGGVEAEYGVDLTSHGTDTYMAAHEWCCAENEQYGVGLIQLDSQLIEFDHIHPDKTDFGNPGKGSAMYSYIANDWLQMHSAGGSHMNYRFRYTLVSYTGNHKEVGIYQMAERMVSPVIVQETAENSIGQLPAVNTMITTDARLVGLKRADNGNGLIARLWADNTPSFATTLGRWSVAAMDESDADKLNDGYSSVRICADNSKAIAVTVSEAADELTIGGVETGLITAPRAVRGENDGMLYLLWGKCRGKVAKYELYRGMTLDFEVNEASKIADVLPEEYVVGRYIDENLAYHTTYYYRVRAVSPDGRYGIFSDVFAGVTKE